jgi:DNA-binding transcriptional LysR family regulator
MAGSIDLNDLFFFAQVVEKGSFTKAARSLGVPKSRLSRRITDLEVRLGVRLLQRTTRSLSLTDIGARYYEQCQVMVAAARGAEQAVANLSSEPRGHLRVSAPLSVAQHDLGPYIGRFLRQYPLVRLELIVTNRRVSLIEDGVDVAVRVRTAEDQDPNLVTRRLRPSPAHLMASPELVAGRTIEHPDDLKELPLLGYGSRVQPIHWNLLGPGGERVTVEVQAGFHAEDFVVLKLAALDGAGVSLLPTIVCWRELAEGKLVRVLPQWSQKTGILHAVYPSSRGLAPAVRAFIDFLVAHTSNDPLA